MFGAKSDAIKPGFNKKKSIKLQIYEITSFWWKFRSKSFLVVSLFFIFLISLDRNLKLKLFGGIKD